MTSWKVLQARLRVGFDNLEDCVERTCIQKYREALMGVIDVLEHPYIRLETAEFYSSCPHVCIVNERSS